MSKVFISYSHQQGDWVWGRLLPCLRAGGVEVLIDSERFKLGHAVVGQMDATQDQADRHLLVLSPDYLSSPYCRHEMDRAIALDLGFERGIVLPVLRETCTLPAAVSGPNPLYADLRNDKQEAPWALLLSQCGADLGATAPDWLAAANKLKRFMERGQSVSLVVQAGVAWQGLMARLQDELDAGMAVVDLESPGTASRRGLLGEILAALGQERELPAPPEDLVEFNRLLAPGDGRGAPRVALTHFDVVVDRPDYGMDLFRALRHLIQQRRLVLLTVSRAPFTSLLPRNHPLSEVNVTTVSLRAAR